MKNKLFFYILTLVSLCAGFAACNETEEENNEKVVLSVAPATIDADGTSEAIFTVKANDTEVTGLATIRCTDGTIVEGAKFSSTTAGEYNFTATYKNQTSNMVTVTVNDVQVSGFRLSVDKSEIEADGVDVATLEITDSEGVVVTQDESQMRYVSFTVLETGESYTRTNLFSAIANGTYTLQAKFKGKPCANTVEVKAINRANYEKYFHMVPIYDLTNIFCSYCPIASKGLEGIASPYKEHSIVMAIHGPFNPNDPWLYTEAANSIQIAFNGGGAYPLIILNLDHKVAATAEEYGSASLGQRVREQMLKSPATCGVKLSSSLGAETTIENTPVLPLSIKVSMTSTLAAKYDLGCALMVDNQPIDLNGSLFSEVDDTVIQMSNNYLYMSTDAFTTVAEQEYSRDFTINIPTALYNQCGGAKNFRVVGFALRAKEGQTDPMQIPLMDNATVAPLGETIDYRLN